ncbi:uncharacterized protein LACBIDRAFT_298776 [Laccaria bicolor S238N-H82]|uniref:Predicted protein n=1 Tax=Laccaria bicolor (strain S238N-H82 / ATCC MYA-4686) TaxID=486041 RepID=B0E3F7_LACBS|nr:uncharacterized protein LACBIDRAFT_298776 [Laccaria bicolor S238N-H82]EDQ98626.1 predicted protein [Laccaria bicolor S238N-H82]|eukprot:XP_001890725.1 predicted protein [Laccaria bicolor S238N-H82]
MAEMILATLLIFALFLIPLAIQYFLNPPKIHPILSIPAESVFLTSAFFLVFASSVQSGFLPPKRATVDRNRSRTDPDIEGTEPNHLGPVYCGLWSRFRPIQTGFFAYNLLYQYKPFVSQLLLL